ncbi:unnamed protein product [Rotaria sp. Silwood1]|nr:unnamed protein product [Rotaria sp. Silwood1]
MPQKNSSRRTRTRRTPPRTPKTTPRTPPRTPKTTPRVDLLVFGIFRKQSDVEIVGNAYLVDCDDVLVDMNKIIAQIWKSETLNIIAKLI